MYTSETTPRVSIALIFNPFITVIEQRVMSMAATEISRKRNPESPDDNGSPKDDDEDEYIVFQKRRRPDPSGGINDST